MHFWKDLLQHLKIERLQGILDAGVSKQRSKSKRLAEDPMTELPVMQAQHPMQAAQPLAYLRLRCPVIVVSDRGSRLEKSSNKQRCARVDRRDGRGPNLKVLGVNTE